MFWSKISIPTLREAPAGLSTIGSRLLARAGYIRGDEYLFLGQRALARISAIVEVENVPVENGLQRCGIEYVTAQTPSGVRFVVPHETGEIGIVRAGDSTAVLEAVTSIPAPPLALDPEGDFSPEIFHTPDCKSIIALADLTGLPKTSLIKSRVMSAHGRPVMVLLRGDHLMSEAKLARVLGVASVSPATPEKMRETFGAGAGSLGPVGVEGARILTDQALRGRRNMIAGANRDDHHLRYVTPGEDFPDEYFDLREVEEGELWNGTPLRIEHAVMLGDPHISAKRVLWAAAEQHHDDDGLILPPAIAPFDLIITLIDASVETQRTAAEKLAASAEAVDMDVLIDDRKERAGVKFKDADLIGIPWRITLGKKLEQGIVEVVERRTRQKSELALDAAVEFIRTRR